MGMFDSVNLPCPHCGYRSRFQSKGAVQPHLVEIEFDPQLNCISGHDIESENINALNGIADKHLECDRCGKHFMVKRKFWIEKVDIS